MEETILRKQFKEYVERMRKVRLLSTPSLEDIGIAEDYSRLLLFMRLPNAANRVDFTIKGEDCEVDGLPGDFMLNLRH